MGLKDELKSQVVEYLKKKWEVRKMLTVPELGQVQLLNDGVSLEAAVLYADMVGSSDLVKNFPATFAATVYKAYLNTACRIIKSQGGEIRAFDGDRVMAIFTDKSKEERATRAAFQLTYAVNEVINPEIEAQALSSGNRYKLKHCVGIDFSEILVARTGIRGTNDLVWVGNAANRAAKLCADRRGGYSTVVSKALLDRLPSNMRQTQSGLVTVEHWSPILDSDDIFGMSASEYGSTSIIKFD